MQPAESNRVQHPVCCRLLDSAGWVPILPSTYTGARSAPAESNRGQHTGCCPPLDSAGCIPMQPVGFMLTHFFYFDLVIVIRIPTVARFSKTTTKKNC